MKAFLLAAGEGRRLQPITRHTPKCIVPVCGRPLIEYWFELLKIHGIKEILINTSHLAGKVKEYVNSAAVDLSIRLTYEDILLGSGGTVKKNWDFIEDEESFFILYADNLTNINLSRMVEFHKRTDKDFTIALFRVPNPTECGIVELDHDSTVVSFIEKPGNPVSDLAFAGIMLSNSRLKDYFPDRDVFDLGYDVLPYIAGKASGYIMDDYMLDIGTHVKLKQAEEDVRNNVLRIGIDCHKKI